MMCFFVDVQFLFLFIFSVLLQTVVISFLHFIRAHTTTPLVRCFSIVCFSVSRLLALFVLSPAQFRQQHIKTTTAARVNVPGRQDLHPHPEVGAQRHQDGAPQDQLVLLPRFPPRPVREGKQN